MIAAPGDWRDWNLILQSEPRRDRRGLWRIHEQRRRERRRVTVVREVLSRRNLLKDDDNRAFSVKPIYDALKRLGLLFDDSSTWVERVFREEPTGRDYTTIRIEPIA